jgi:hypothetical protein
MQGAGGKVGRVHESGCPATHHSCAFENVGAEHDAHSRTCCRALRTSAGPDRNSMFRRLLFCSSSGRGIPSTALRGFALATRMGDAWGFAPPFCFVAFACRPLHSFL